MYVWEINYQWLRGDVAEARVRSADVEGPGFSGYDSIDSAWVSITQWRNRTAGNVGILSIEITER